MALQNRQEQISPPTAFDRDPRSHFDLSRRTRHVTALLLFAAAEIRYIARMMHSLAYPICSAVLGAWLGKRRGRNFERENGARKCRAWKFEREKCLYTHRRRVRCWGSGHLVCRRRFQPPRTYARPTVAVTVRNFKIRRVARADAMSRQMSEWAAQNR